MPFDIVISYSRKNCEQVDALVKWLQAGGMSVWIDRGGIEAARDWSGEIARSIRECKVLLLVASRASFASDEVSKEVKLAWKHRRPILPIYIEPAEIPDRLSYELSGIQHVEFFGDGEKKAQQEIIQTLTSLGVAGNGQGLPATPLPHRHRLLLRAGAVVLLAAAALTAWGLKTAHRHSVREPELKGLWALKGHHNTVTCLAVSADGTRALSGGEDHTVRLWDVYKTNQIYCFTNHTDWVRGVAISSDGKLGVSCGGDRTVRVWDLTTGEQRCVFTNHTASVVAVALSPDGRRALSGSWDKTVRLWDLARKEETWRLDWQQAPLCLAFAPDGSEFLCGGDDKCIQIAQVGGDEVTHEPVTMHRGTVHCVAISRDGRWVISGGDDGIVRLRVLNRTSDQMNLNGHDTNSVVRGVAFTTDSQIALSAGEDGTVRLWNVTNATPVGPAITSNLPQKIWAIAIAPKANARQTDIVLIAGNDGDIRVCELAR